MIALALQTAAAFNLVCTVTFAGTDSRPTPLIIRVDLDARRFCLDQCVQTNPIVSVTDSEIIFQNGVSEASGILIRRVVGGESRRYYASLRSEYPGRVIETSSTGTCAAAPFTGFPSRSF
ncbi:MAG TPA: hypothetical protein VEX35_08180 [Allosphingosinicella sp.]|nr:hypothetical protein [Allosphingosinicella sp.]